MIDYSIIGKRFGRLVVLNLDHVSEKNHNSWWKCRCDCGREVVVYRGSLTSGDSISCGCYHREHVRDFPKTHGMSSTPLYSTWSGMVQRCTNQNAKNYERYGGRGVTVCSEWENDFKNFHDWAVMHGYEQGLTIDRKDNDLGYSPDNCRWVDRITQQNNTRRNKLVTFNGETRSIAEWSRILGINHETLRYRVNRGNMNDFEQYFMRESK